MHAENAGREDLKKGGVLPEESLKAPLAPPHGARDSAGRGANSVERGSSLTKAPSCRCHGDGRLQSAQALSRGHRRRAVTGGAENRLHDRARRGLLGPPGRNLARRRRKQRGGGGGVRTPRGCGSSFACAQTPFRVLVLYELFFGKVVKTPVVVNTPGPVREPRGRE